MPRAARRSRALNWTRLVGCFRLLLLLLPWVAAGVPPGGSRKLLQGDDQQPAAPSVIITELLPAPLRGWAHREDIKRFAKKERAVSSSGGGRRLLARSGPTAPATTEDELAIPAAIVPRTPAPPQDGVTSRLPPPPPMRFMISDRDPAARGTPIVDNYATNITAGRRLLPRTPRAPGSLLAPYSLLQAPRLSVSHYPHPPARHPPLLRGWTLPRSSKRL